MYRLPLSFALLTMMSALAAHPPMSVDLEFDAETHMLTVNYTHDTDNLAAHYINAITVSINDEVMIRQSQHTQAGATGGTLVYTLVDAKPGDTLSVKVECNMHGHKVATLTLE